MKTKPAEVFKALAHDLSPEQGRVTNMEASEHPSAASQKPDISIKRYEHLTQAANAFIFTVIVKAGHTVCSIHYPGVFQVTGYTENDYAAYPQLWFDMIHADDKEIVLQQIAALLRGETPPPITHRILHKDGSLRWVRNTSVPVFDSQGNLTGYDGLIVDISHLQHDKEEKDRQINALSSALIMVKTLHSLLPICCSCKKIRDDKGYWQQLETYLEGHYSSIAFTHGICPDCARKLYPQHHEVMYSETSTPAERKMLPFAGQDHTA